MQFRGEYGFRTERPGIGEVPFTPWELDMLKSAWIIGAILSGEKGQPAVMVAVSVAGRVDSHNAIVVGDRLAGEENAP